MNSKAKKGAQQPLELADTNCKPARRVHNDSKSHATSLQKKGNSRNARHLDMQPGIASGRVVHHRYLPKVHHFEYQMSWFLLDVDDLSGWSEQSALLGYNRWSIYSLHDKDYIDSRSEPIKQKLRQFLASQNVEEHSGATLLFTHPRFLGFGFNSVSFYFCFEAGQIKYIISEINNTPWGEKHLYLHDCRSQSLGKGEYSQPGKLQFKFDKQFHISPFLDMDIRYTWDFAISQQGVKVTMALHRKNVKVLHVYLDAEITPVVDNQHSWIKLSRMFQPLKMWFGIYWQALKLWIKKIPFYSHPDKT